MPPYNVFCFVSDLRANSFAERLRLQLAVIHGDPKAEDGRNSPPPFEPIALTPSKSSEWSNIVLLFSCIRVTF